MSRPVCHMAASWYGPICLLFLDGQGQRESMRRIKSSCWAAREVPRLVARTQTRRAVRRAAPCQVLKRPAHLCHCATVPLHRSLVNYFPTFHCRTCHNVLHRTQAAMRRCGCAGDTDQRQPIQARSAGTLVLLFILLRRGTRRRCGPLRRRAECRTIICQRGGGEGASSLP